MGFLESIILGIIQGFTEFLPISSSGHLIFVPKLFGWADQGLAFDVMMHMGTLLAVVVYFRTKLWAIVKAVLGIKNKEMENGKYETEVNYRKLGWLLVLSIIPAGIIGLLFKDWIEVYLRMPIVIGIGLIFWGVILGVADNYSRKLTFVPSSGRGKVDPKGSVSPESKKSLGKINWKTTLFIGCAQAVALIPGTSRSGITMTAGLFSKLDKKSAAEFSFLMSVPVIALAGLLNIVDLVQHGLGDMMMSYLLVGFVASAVSGFVAIWGLMKIIQKWSFMPFVVYRVVVGILILIFMV